MMEHEGAFSNPELTIEFPVFNKRDRALYHLAIVVEYLRLTGFGIV